MFIRRRKYVYLKRKRFENNKRLERILRIFAKVGTIALTILRIFETILEILQKLGLLVVHTIFGSRKRKYITRKN